MMKPHRIFIAITMPEKVKEELLAYQKKWAELPARWTASQNLHLTLAFLGNTSEQELAEVSRFMQRVGDKHESFELAILRIAYGPDIKRPQMIWALIEKSPELMALQKDVEHIRPEQRSYEPHLTLARLKTFELQRMEFEELPEVNEEISLSFQVNSFDIMESKLKRSGAEYTTLQRFMLQK